MHVARASSWPRAPVARALGAAPPPSSGHCGPGRTRLVPARALRHRLSILRVHGLPVAVARVARGRPDTQNGSARAGLRRVRARGCRGAMAACLPASVAFCGWSHPPARAPRVPPPPPCSGHCEPGLSARHARRRTKQDRQSGGRARAPRDGCLRETRTRSVVVQLGLLGRARARPHPPMHDHVCREQQYSMRQLSASASPHKTAQSPTRSS